MGDVSEIASGSGSTTLSIVEEPAELETAILNANVTVDQVLILTN